MKPASQKFRRLALATVCAFAWLDGFLHNIVEPSWLWAIVIIVAFFAFFALTELLARIYIRYGPDL